MSEDGNTSVIEVRNLSVRFGSRRALKHISLRVPGGAVMAVIGPSGSGKTTLLRALNRMNELAPRAKTHGKVLLNGHNIYRPGVDLASLRRRVGMVFQQPNPFPASVFDNVAFGLRLLQVTAPRVLEERVEAALRQASLWHEVRDHLEVSALELSLGQQQRLVLARTLAVEPDVVLLDEPASALDPISTLRIEELMESLRSRYTVVLVTHNIQQAARVADLTAFIDGGKVIEVGETTSLFTNPKHAQTEEYITGRYG